MNDDILIMFYEDYLDEVYGIDAKDRLKDVPGWYRDKEKLAARDRAITDRWTEMMTVEDIEE